MPAALEAVMGAIASVGMVYGVSVVYRSWLQQEKDK